MKEKTVRQIGVLVLAVVLAVGCASLGKGPSDKDQVQAMLGAWKAAAIEKNTDKMMALYSEEFSHSGSDYQAADKAALRKFSEECKQKGYFDGVEIATNNATINIQGNMATISGIDWTNNQGTAAIELTAKKGKTGWLIANMSIAGI